jgi:hypothetical protein
MNTNHQPFQARMTSAPELAPLNRSRGRQSALAFWAGVWAREVRRLTSAAARFLESCLSVKTGMLCAHEPRGRSAGFQTGFSGRRLPKAGLEAGAPAVRFMGSAHAKHFSAHGSLEPSFVRSSRGNEALTFGRRRVSLLTSAATRFLERGNSTPTIPRSRITPGTVRPSGASSKAGGVPTKSSAGRRVFPAVARWLLLACSFGLLFREVAAHAQQGLDNLVATVGTTIQDATPARRHWAFLLWQGSTPTLLFNRSIAIYAKPGAAADPAPFVRLAVVSQQTDPRNIERRTWARTCPSWSRTWRNSSASSSPKAPSRGPKSSPPSFADRWAMKSMRRT